jgi:hypothetical protein
MTSQVTSIVPRGGGQYLLSVRPTNVDAAGDKGMTRTAVRVEKVCSCIPMNGRESVK